MATEELAFSIKKRGNKKKGSLIYYASKRIIKAKWAELVSICNAPTGKMKVVSEKSPYYQTLRNYYPNAEIKTKNNLQHILVTPREASYIYWVVAGEMKESVFKSISESWDKTLPIKYQEAYKEESLEQMYDDYIVNIKGLRNGLGKDVRGDADIIDTWMWGSGDKKISFVTQVNGMNERAFRNHKKSTPRVNFNKVAMSGDSKKEVMNDEFVFEPRRNKQIKFDLIKWDE